MSQSHEKQLIEALRVVCGGEKSEVSPELGDEIVKAIREEIVPLVELAAFPHWEYLDEIAASFYCIMTVSTCSVSAWTEKALCTSKMVPRCFMPARIWIGSKRLSY